MSESVAAPAIAPEPAAAPAPVVAAPEPVAAAPAPAPEQAAPAAPQAPAAAPLHTDTATLLEGAGKPAEAKPGEPAAAPAPAPVVAEPTKYEFKIPETVKIAPEQIGAVSEILGAHGVPAEKAQALLDMHTSALTKFAENTLAEQHRAFAETRAGWREQIKGDAELGGAGFQTTQAAIARMRDMLVPEKHRGEFNEFLRVTGAGDHPAFWRALHTAARIFDEPAMPVQPNSPPPNNGRPPGRASMTGIYDHPSSQRRAG